MNNYKDIWFTSDLHFCHNNIIKYCDRPTDIEKHNDFIIEKLNSHIKPDDTVYCLGDISLGYYQETIECLKRLNGNWIIIGGNHDNDNRMNTISKEVGFKYYSSPYGRVIVNKKIEYDNHGNKKLFILSHFPIESWELKNRGSIHCHGHVHNHPTAKIPNRFNVCFDLEYRPFHISELINDKG